MEPTLRITARVVPVNDAGEVLLLQDRDPARPDEPRWGTIGGAVESGETLVAAALRELHEETGVVAEASQLTEPFYRDQHEFSWDGTTYLGDSTFFAMWLDRDVSISFDHLEPTEVGNVLEARWWMPQDLDEHAGFVTPDLGLVVGKALGAVQAGQPEHEGES